MNNVFRDALSLARANLLGKDFNMPNLRFFTPLPIFWKMLTLVCGEKVLLVDCGCGKGDLISEGITNDRAILGIDVMPRENQDSKVMSIDAMDYKWSPTVWPLICRPSHEGWVSDVVKNALSQGATPIYVSLNKNRIRDLEEYQENSWMLHIKVGQDGEHMWVILPNKAPVKQGIRGYQKYLRDLTQCQAK